MLGCHIQYRNKFSVTPCPFVKTRMNTGSGLCVQKVTYLVIAFCADTTSDSIFLKTRSP